MATRIGLSSGKEFLVDSDVGDVASKIVGTDPYLVFGADGSRVYIYRAHVAYVEDAGASKETRYEHMEKGGLAPFQP